LTSREGRCVQTAAASQMLMRASAAFGREASSATGR
jgi:hypothetical protein